MTSENDIQKQIMDAAANLDGVTLYRNNTGAAKMGKRWVKFGLCKGSSDLIGWTEVEISPDMVGETVAVFTAIEVKKPGGKTTYEQIEFGDSVIRAGGKFGVAESVDEALDIVEGLD